MEAELKLADENCALCKTKLSANASVYEEGKFCADAGGCRRRALKMMRNRTESVMKLTIVIESLTETVLSLKNEVLEKHGKA